MINNRSHLKYEEPVMSARAPEHATARQCRTITPPSHRRPRVTPHRGLNDPTGISPFVPHEALVAVHHVDVALETHHDQP
jgi:hypothetical protein